MGDGGEITLGAGRRLRFHDCGAPGESRRLNLIWHHGSPQTGLPLAPVQAAAEDRGIRLISYARPGYGGSSREEGREVAGAAADTGAVAAALGVNRFAVMGASGGGPHALACAASLGTAVVGTVTLAGLAPFSPEPSWFAGMQDPPGLRAAAEGPEARQAHAENADFDEESFTARDWAALRNRWTSLAEDAGEAAAEGSAGLVDDDLAFAAPWGVDIAAIDSPVLVIQGGEDRVVPPSHAERLTERCEAAELWLRPRDGHISILDAIPLAMDWLLANG